LLTGMLLSDKDNIFLHGQSLQKNTPQIFSSVGCLIETPSLYLHLTGKENLRLITTLRGLERSRIDAVLSTVRLIDAANRKVKEYSLGMKQRLGIAMALLSNPSLLILDEPVNGLDPTGIIEIRELLIHLNKQEGKTVFISSHLLYEIEKTCTHIGIINRGALRYQGTLDEMKNTAYASGEVVFKIAQPDHWAAPLQAHFNGLRRQSQDEFIFPFTQQSDVATINQQLVGLNVPVSGIHIRGGLEEWFMQIISNDKQTA
jgi:ABC-2 type transport system ATP-binding protein